MEQTMIKRVRTTPTKRSKQSSTMTLKASGHSKKENVSKNALGNIQNSIKKYTTLAQEAMTSGDRILAESLYQQAEHYLRLNNECKGNKGRPITTKSAPSKQKRIAPPNDFELSIEQELTMAQCKV